MWIWLQSRGPTIGCDRNRVTDMATVRPAAVAGMFYPADAVVLRRTVEELIGGEPRRRLDVRPRMLIVPHAGYVYSGSVAATAYRRILDLGDVPRRIVLLGPSHFVWHEGLASPGAAAMASPLGEVLIDHDLEAAALTNPVVHSDPATHAEEHSLEVQLPFLQVLLEGFSLLPLVTGDIEPEIAAEVLDEAMSADDVLGVISSDLSHYLDYETASRRDGRTAMAITELRWADVFPHDACGRIAVQSALLVAERRHWECRLLDLRNSGDTAGSRERVVGYGAFVLGPET